MTVLHYFELTKQKTILSNQQPARMKITIVSLIAIFVVTGCSKSGSTPVTPTPTVPSATINDVAQERTTSTSTFTFKVVLSQAATKDATVKYTTVAGTALENTDFAPATGTLTITAGSLSATAQVQVTGDSLRKADQVFYLQLSNAQNCTLAGTKATGTIINQNLLYYPVDNAGYSTPTNYSGYTLAWSDDFTGNAVNSNNWGFESGNNNGWGNHEMENYTDRTQNAFVTQGNLIIEARQESYGGNSYTSARMITKNKQSFKYGRIDIRAKLPSGKGVWPALWLLGSNIDQVGWPACGEIDLMELLGQESNKVYGTLHWGSSVATHTSKGTNYILPTGSFDQQFHVFSLLWGTDSLKMLVDDHQYFAVADNDIGPVSPFDSNFFLIFNIAVGGDWPGAPDGTTKFPQRMAVDYVRVFQKQ